MSAMRSGVITAPVGFWPVESSIGDITHWWIHTIHAHLVGVRVPRRWCYKTGKVVLHNNMVVGAYYCVSKMPCLLSRAPPDNLGSEL